MYFRLFDRMTHVVHTVTSDTLNSLTLSNENRLRHSLIEALAGYTFPWLYHEASNAATADPAADHNRLMAGTKLMTTNWCKQLAQHNVIQVRCIHFSVSTVTCTCVTCYIKYQSINQSINVTIDRVVSMRPRRSKSW